MATAPTVKPAPAVIATNPAGIKAVMSTSGSFSADGLAPDSTSFPSVYEAALLYAADQCDAAELVLKEYLRTSDGKNSIRAWLMMFDFYQLTNNHQEFDSLSLLFAVKFERTSPIWIDSAQHGDPRRREKRDRKDFFVFAPVPGGTLLSEIDRLESFAGEMGSARIDFTKIKSIHAEEAELFAMVLQRTRQAKVPFWFNQLDAFASLLKQGINAKTGKPPDESQGYWSLLFELFIFDGRLQEYEDLGLQFAVAFEMSPPVWEVFSRPAIVVDDNPGVPAGLSNDASTSVQSDLNAGFALNGVVGTACKEMLHQLSVFASSKKELVVDMSGLLRIDFSATGMFIEAIRAIHLSQKRVVLSNLNELVAALLEVFGTTKYAIIMRKKSV